MMIEALRKKIKAWLDGGNADYLVEKVISSEMSDAIEAVRPEIKAICQESVRKAVDDLKAEGVLLDKNKMGRLLNDAFEESMDTYSDEIEETLYEQLIVELKASKIFGR